MNTQSPLPEESRNVGLCLGNPRLTDPFCKFWHTSNILSGVQVDHSKTALGWPYQKMHFFLERVCMRVHECAHVHECVCYMFLCCMCVCRYVGLCTCIWRWEEHLDTQNSLSLSLVLTDISWNGSQQVPVILLSAPSPLPLMQLQAHPAFSKSSGDLSSCKPSDPLGFLSKL